MTGPLDVLVPVSAWRFVTVATTSAGAEAACREAPFPFDGAELMPIFGLPVTSRVDWSAGWVALPVEAALLRRGAVLVNRAGRMAVSMGGGKVVQPCGRTYALASTGEQWWVQAWVHRGLITTLVADRGGLLIRLPDPGEPAGSALGRGIVFGTVNFAGTATGPAASKAGTAAGAVTFTGAAAGSRASSGAAVGAVTFGGGTVTGVRPVAALMTDDFTGTDGSAWDAAKWTQARATAGAAATRVSGWGRLAAGTVTNYGGHQTMRYNASLTDQEWLLTFRFPSVAGDGRLEVITRADSLADGANGYVLHLQVNGSCGLTKAASYTYTALGTFTATFTAGTSYRLRFRAVGTTVQARVWPAASAEPSTWDVSVTDSAVASGYPIVDAHGGAAAGLVVELDDVQLTNGA